MSRLNHFLRWLSLLRRKSWLRRLPAGVHRLSVQIWALLLLRIPNVGGFSDAVFRVVASFLSDDANHFVAEVAAVEL
jgi:hypothetical protein